MVKKQLNITIDLNEIDKKTPYVDSCKYPQNLTSLIRKTVKKCYIKKYAK